MKHAVLLLTIKEALRVDRAGKLRWRRRPVEHFKSQSAANHFNCRYPGKRAGSISPDGKRQVFITIGHKAHNISADTIIHALKTGRWPR